MTMPIMPFMAVFDELQYDAGGRRQCFSFAIQEACESGLADL